MVLVASRWHLNDCRCEGNTYSTADSLPHHTMPDPAPRGASVMFRVNTSRRCAKLVMYTTDGVLRWKRLMVACSSAVRFLLLAPTGSAGAATGGTERGAPFLKAGFAAAMAGGVKSLPPSVDTNNAAAESAATGHEVDGAFLSSSSSSPPVSDDHEGLFERMVVCRFFLCTKGEHGEGRGRAPHGRDCPHDPLVRAPPGGAALTRADTNAPTQVDIAILILLLKGLCVLLSLLKLTIFFARWETRKGEKRVINDKCGCKSGVGVDDVKGPREPLARHYGMRERE